MGVSLGRATPFGARQTQRYVMGEAMPALVKTSKLEVFSSADLSYTVWDIPKASPPRHLGWRKPALKHTGGSKRQKTAPVLAMLQA